MNSKLPAPGTYIRVVDAQGPVVAGQAIVTTTGQAVPLSLHDATHDLVTTITVAVLSIPNSAGPITVGGVGLTTVLDGTGNGFPMYVGQSPITLAVANAGDVYINGPAGSVVAYYGS